MSTASATSEKHVADATLQQFLSLLLQSANLAPGSAPDSFVATLNALCADHLVSHWLEGIELSEPTETENTEETSDRLAQLAALLPELALSSLSKFPASPEATENLIAAAHLAIRARAFEASALKEIDRRQSDLMYNMAYGLSHEFNNPLANISTRAGVLLQRHREGRDADMLRAIVDASMRGSEMLGDLMLLARPPQLELRPEPLSELVDTALKKAQPLAKRQFIEMEYHRNDKGWMVNVDRAAFGEVLWALLRNSIEACGRNEFIQIRSQSSATELRLIIIDSGPGLSTEALRHCFTPYFSGREAGRGLGLGLAKAKRIIELMNGELELRNAIAGGCEVRLSLPQLPCT